MFFLGDVVRNVAPFPECEFLWLFNQAERIEQNIKGNRHDMKCSVMGARDTVTS